MVEEFTELELLRGAIGIRYERENRTILFTPCEIIQMNYPEIIFDMDKEHVDELIDKAKRLQTLLNAA